MDFRFSEEQRMLKKAARDFAQSECPSDFVRKMEQDTRGYTNELWEKMAELDWMGLMLPEEYGGMELGILELVVIMEQLGVACVPGPYLETVLSAHAVLKGGSTAQKKRLLPKVAAGELVLSLAYLEPGSTKYEPSLVTTTATWTGDCYLLKGTKLFVQDAQAADYLVVSARTSGSEFSRSGISLFLVPRETMGVCLTPLKTVAGDKQFALVLEEVKVPEDYLLGQLGNGFTILDEVLKMGAVAKCAEMVGGASRVQELTVDYTKDREQFGQPIGRFQAVQHHCANMAMDLHGSRYITYKAAWLLSEGLPSDKVVASAKGWVSEAYKRICAVGHQIGAATAYMVDHDMTLYSRRAKAAELAFGDSAYHRKQMAEAMDL